MGLSLQKKTTLTFLSGVLSLHSSGLTLRALLDVHLDAESAVPLGLAARMVIQLAERFKADEIKALSEHNIVFGLDGQVSIDAGEAVLGRRFQPYDATERNAEIFVLGAIFHFALTGFEGMYAEPSVSLTLPSARHPDVPGALDTLVMEALSMAPEARPGGQLVFSKALQSLLKDSVFSAAVAGEHVRRMMQRVEEDTVPGQPARKSVMPPPVSLEESTGEITVIRVSAPDARRRSPKREPLPPPVETSMTAMTEMALVDDTQPRAMVKLAARQVTQEELEWAHGQEALPTPPWGGRAVAAASGESTVWLQRIFVAVAVLLVLLAAGMVYLFSRSE